ncbi:hypothetical protein BC936DRAFT_149012 [Jimgerdemannia flammicorona]|uniref:AIG1-type G domain-containing protein n=1 Tax=Jimgerdemannia flammicorona TaxID=994334 RepID=A0A433DKF6_9FUNG|nr:hypothetical protein BC936DRAFT_149012 [Jimgerdemannia flammicorona]
MADTTIPTNDRENLVIAVMGAMGMGTLVSNRPFNWGTLFPSPHTHTYLVYAFLLSCRYLALDSLRHFLAHRQPVTRTILDATKPWRLPPVDRNVHIVDTPGMCDSSFGDRNNAEEIVRFFKTLSYGVSAFIIVFNVCIRIHPLNERRTHVISQKGGSLIKVEKIDA